MVIANKVPGFGYENKYFGSPGRKDLLSDHSLNNSLKVLGCFPVVGLCTGILRIKIALRKPVQGNALNNKAKYSKMHILRGAIEILSLGAFLFPVDVFVTLIRNCKYGKN